MTGRVSQLALGVVLVVLGAICALVLVVSMMGADAQDAACGGGAGGPGIAPSQAALADIPANYLLLYQQAAASSDLGGDGWAWLAGFGKIESDHGRLQAPGVTSGANPWGAAGPMQIGIGGAAGNTWAQYATDGNDDGRKDVYDPRDAIPAAAKYLKAAGAPQDWRRAAFAYNHAAWYVDEVAQKAAEYRGAAQADSSAISVADPQAGQPAPPSPISTVVFPTRPSGPIISTPADHQARPLGNWHSDNAVDIGVPTGTPVLAVADGTIVKGGGTPPTHGAGVIGGFNLTLKSADNEFFYTHMTRALAHVGQRVQAGEVIGKSGYANNVEHLHIGVEHGDAMQLWGNGAANAQTAQLGGCPTGNPVGPANLGQATQVDAPQQFTVLPAWAMAGGRAPAQLDARLIPDALWILQTYRLRVTAARETGHQSHGDGTALDLVPASGNDQPTWDSTALRLARDIGWTAACAAAGVAPACPLKPWVRFVGYNGYPLHGDPAHVGANAHIHVSWLASEGPTAALSAPHPWVRVFPVPASTGSADL